MSKRVAATVDGEPQAEKRQPKRPKLDTPRGPPPKAEEIVSSRQLQQLLTFQQGANQELRNGIFSFKKFLESILYPTEDSTGRQRAILKDFLDTQTPRIIDNDSPFLSNVMQTWSYASQSDNDQLLSAVVAVLALLLKTLSSHIDFREQGTQLCRTILQIPQLKLLARGLNAPKHKESVISPCLRLLTEIVCFDGGTLAKQVYSKRDLTFDAKVLARNLGLWKASGSPEKDRKRPSVRTNAVKYVLSHLRIQDEGVKIDILKQVIVIRALFDHIREDSPEVASEILQVVKSHVISDREIPKSSKSFMLTDRALSNIASLYRVEQNSEEEANSKSIDIVAHQFLLHVCTVPEAGVVHPSSGWYPPGTDKDGERGDQEDLDSIDLGLDSLEWYERYRGRVVIRNTTLANFVQVLRPYANKLEQELLLDIFEAVPEIVADYFFKKNNFTFDPKLTATWIGYSSFLFSAVHLPTPKHFGRKDGYASVPPPASIAIESILPQPLTQKVLTKCLNQNADLITFFVIRLLTVAFQKLDKTLQEFRKASSRFSHSLWDQAAERLVNEFRQRCPKMKDVISSFRSIPHDHLIQREAVTRLLSMYYVLLPQVALDEKFDISLPLTNMLKTLEEEAGSDEDREIRLLELSHLVQIARNSPDMRWWQKPESLQFSPFTSVLKVLVSSGDGASSQSIAQLLVSVVRDNSILQLESRPSSFDALVASLRLPEQKISENAVFKFLDECFGRFVRKPLKYQDDLEALAAENLSNCSLFLATVLEQWPFVVKTKGDDARFVAEWASRFLSLLKKVGEDGKLLQTVLDGLLKDSKGESWQKVLSNALESDSVEVMPLAEDVIEQEGGVDVVANGTEDVGVSLELPPEEDQNHPGLHRWIQKEVDEAVDDGNIGDLLLCLCSTHVAIRKQALSNVQKLMAKVQASTHEESELLYLLLGEVVETSRPVIDNKPLPYIAGSFAADAVGIIADPAHIMYPKVAAFLTKGPSWKIPRLPSYWAEKTLLNPPEGDDDAYWQEASWLLSYFLEGLRTAEDMEIFRARGIFERVLALYSQPDARRETKEKILRLCFRAAAVDGSTTLITRSGIVSWIRIHTADPKSDKTVLRRLLERLWETCDRAKVFEWSGGGVEKEVQKMLAEH
ncbi:ribosome 60S biogenesis N-terminal-domain-containing protein [Phyllosticta citribraziliensis]|uniref:Ribosome 60S biogenesis N-terminal-domain-containing protein n=1 Tax=Phyllosticta citribraziliensis TaxID=989973 RepID=A0ABR1LVJ0_9PEZI